LAEELTLVPVFNLTGDSGRSKGVGKEIEGEKERGGVDKV
jgi:hypothetical protein